MLRYALTPLILGPLLLSISACGGKEPGEDAVAIVDGYEITEAELTNELVARGADDLQDPAARQEALEAIVSRKLLVNLAEERDLDNTPDYILAEQRSRELLLADAAAVWLVSFDEGPNTAKIDELVRSTGGERFFYKIEGLRFSEMSDPDLRQKIEQAETFDNVRQVLNAEKVEVQPTNVVWDSASLPGDLVGQLNGLSDEEPFVIIQNDAVFAGVIRQKQKQSLNADQSRQLAEGSVKQESAIRTLNEWLNSARSTAEITYKDGYGPKKPAAVKAD